MENMKLNNNLECPMLGLGTFMLSPEDAYTSTLEALKMGYSLIDTANAYVNERAVGRAIKDSGIDRKNIFLSTKIWASEYENENTVEETLEIIPPISPAFDLSKLLLHRVLYGDVVPNFSDFIDRYDRVVYRDVCILQSCRIVDECKFIGP